MESFTIHMIHRVEVPVAFTATGNWRNDMGFLFLWLVIFIIFLIIARWIFGVK